MRDGIQMIQKNRKEKIISILIILWIFIIPSFLVVPTVISAFPDYDVNMDGSCNILDLIQISNKMGQTGAPGWIREDVDKNGNIRILDMTLVSNHYGESGWNHPPVVSNIPDQTITKGSTFATITLDDYVTDEEDPDSAITWSTNTLTYLSVSINSINHIATITVLDENWNGFETVTFTATDTDSLTNSDDATFTVIAQNDSDARIQKMSICYSGHLGHNDGCREFLAAHFDLLDTEGYYPQHANTVRGLASAYYNAGTRLFSPNITILAYYNVLMEPSFFPDFAFLNDGNHEDYFMHDSIGHSRVYGDTYTSNPIMNPASIYSGWGNYYATRAQNLLNGITYPSYPTAYDGIFADCVYSELPSEEFTNYLLSSWDFNRDGIADWNTNGPLWGDYTYSILQNTQNLIGNKMIMPNAWKWTEYCQNITHVHIWENFIHDDGAAYNANGYSITTSLNAINLLHTQAELGNKIATHSGCKTDSAHELERKQWMLYCYACLAFAVVDTNKAYYTWMFYGQDSSNGWYSEMDMVLGQPVDEDYYHVTGTPYVYAREFTNYYVAANLNLLGTGNITFTLWGQTITLPPKQAVFIEK
jgi:hypothetical protein